MSDKGPQHSSLDVLDELAAWLFGAGVLALALFPLALPAIALTAIAVLPLVLVPLAAGIAFAVLAAPLLLAQRVWRLARGLWRLARARGSGSSSCRRMELKTFCR